MEAYADPLKYYEPDPPNTTNPKEVAERLAVNDEEVGDEEDDDGDDEEDDRDGGDNEMIKSLMIDVMREAITKFPDDMVLNTNFFKKRKIGQQFKR